MADKNTTFTLSRARSVVVRVMVARRTHYIAGGIAGGIVVVGLLGFFAAPPLIRHIAEQQLSRQLDRPTQIARIRFNPYTLRMEVEGLHIGDRAANSAAPAAGAAGASATAQPSAPFIDIGRVIVKPSWSSLFRFAPVIDEVSIDAPQFHLVRYDADRFNFSDLIAKFSTPSAPSQHNSKPARFAVSNIRITHARIDFDDRLLGSHHVLDQGAIGIPFIATLSSDTNIFVTPSLRARIDGSLLALDGKIKPFSQSRESDIALTLQQLDLAKLASYAPASVPVMVKSADLSTHLNVRFAIDSNGPTIRIDGTADLAKIDITDRQQSPLISATAMHIALADAEPLRDIYKVNEFTLTQPDIHLTRDKSGALNVEQLAGDASTPAKRPAPIAAAASSPLPPNPASQSASGAAPASTGSPASSASSASPKSAPIDLSIHHLAISDGHIGFNDAMPAQPVGLGLSSLDVTLDDFSTLAAAPAHYALKTAIDHGGAFNAKGDVSIAAKRATAQLALDALALPPLQPYVDRAAPVRIGSGTLSAHLPVMADWSHAQPAVHLGAGDVSIDALKIEPPPHLTPYAGTTLEGSSGTAHASRRAIAASASPLTLRSAVANIHSIDLSDRDLVLDSVQLTGLNVSAKRLKNGTIDLLDAFAPPSASASARSSRSTPRAMAHTSAAPTIGASVAATPSTAADATPQAAWQYRVGTLSLADSTIDLTDATASRPVHLHITPLNVSVKSISNDMSRPLDVDGKLTLNGKGALGVAGTVTPNPLSLALHIDGSQIDAAAFEPYFGSKLNVAVASALLNANGDVAMHGTGPSLAARYRGDVSLTNVRMIDKVTADPFAGWTLLGANHLSVDYSAKGTDVDAAKVIFARFYGRVLLDAQGKLNLRDVVASEHGPAKSVTRETSEMDHTTPSAATAAAASTSSVDATAKSPTADAPRSASGASASSTPPVKLHFGELVLQKGSVNYTDNFIRPNYTANLVSIVGTIGAFGTDATTAAPVDVAANLDANGPVSIKGQVNPLIAKPSLDLSASAHDIELTNLTPYSSKYAGYPITKGKLNVDLHYQLANDKLSANNHLFIDQLTFGDHVDNTTATHLPVRLAISLLKNSRGQIDVNIPISGSLSNPQFSVGALVWHAILNLVEKAVTSPFSLLTNAFGGGSESLDYVAFEPGSASLSDTAQKKLDTIAKALQDKPSVKLDLSARVDPPVDEPALRAAYVERQVRLAKLNDTGNSDGNADTSKVTLSAAEYTKYLTKAYKATDFKKPRNMIGLTKTLPDEEMKRALAEHAPVNDAALRALAQQRAANVQAFFDARIDRKRVFVTAPTLSSAASSDKANKDVNAGSTTRVDFSLK